MAKGKTGAKKAKSAAKETPPEAVSRRAFAKKVGCSEARVRQAIDEGKIPKDCLTKEGKILVEKAKEEWAKNQRPSTIKNKELHEAIGTSQAARLEDLETMTLAQLEIKEKAIKVAKDDIDLKAKEKAYLPANNVISSLFHYGAVVRANVQAIPRQIVDDIIACDNDRPAILKLLETSLADALEALSTMPDMEKNL